jgi:membrane associated rhomboid family serine protease
VNIDPEINIGSWIVKGIFYPIFGFIFMFLAFPKFVMHLGGFIVFTFYFARAFDEEFKHQMKLRVHKYPPEDREHDRRIEARRK